MHSILLSLAALCTHTRTYSKCKGILSITIVNCFNYNKYSNFCLHSTTTFSSQDGWTALDLASNEHHTDLVKVLLASGAHHGMKYLVSIQNIDVVHTVALYSYL